MNCVAQSAGAVGAIFLKDRFVATSQRASNIGKIVAWFPDPTPHWVTLNPVPGAPPRREDNARFRFLQADEEMRATKCVLMVPS